jgi:hypothetical protein
MYDVVYAAPNNARAQQLYARIGAVYAGDTAGHDDQGFGFYAF